MAKENAYLFLSDSSLEELEKSKGAMILIHYPECIEIYKKEIARLTEEKKPIILESEELKKGYEDLFRLPLAQRIFGAKKIREEKQDYVNKISMVAKKLADIDSLMADYHYYILEASQEIDQFTHMLFNINLEPKDVLEAYQEIRAMLEAKEKGIVIPAEPVAREVASAAEQVAPAEEVKKPAQPKTTGTKEARLSPREKFERRLARTKEIQEQSQRQQ